MKKYKLYMFGCVIALAALFLPGCNSEETLVDNSAKVEKGKLSFVLPLGGKKAVTYAASDGLDEEYELHNLRIYWFNENDDLHKIFGYGEGVSWLGITPHPDSIAPIDLTQGDRTTLVTISVGDYPHPSKFYIVANVNGDTSPDMIESDDLKAISNGTLTPTRQEFEKILSKALNADGKVRLLGTPIPMSVADTTETPGGYYEVNDPTQVSAPVTTLLKRRVARFDIINSADFSNFEIKKIVITGAQTTGFIQDKPFVDNSAAWDPANTYKFEVTKAVIDDTIPPFNGPRVTNPVDILGGGDGIDDAFQGQDALNSEYLTKAAFYLYPTTIDNSGTKTQISIEGVYNKTVNSVYMLDLSAFANNSIDIKANKLYRIRVEPHRDNQLKFKLEVADWDEGDTVTTVSKGKTIANWGILASTANASLAAGIDTISDNFVYEYSSSAQKPDTLVFQTQGYGLKDNLTTKVSFLEKGQANRDYLPSDFNRIDTATIISTTDLTYATGGVYTTTHKIALPPTKAPIEVRLQIINAVKPDEVKFVTIRSSNYNFTGYKPVRVNGVVWAPLNVGADTLPPFTSGIEMPQVGTDQVSNAVFARIVGDHYQWGRSVPFSSLNVNTFTPNTATRFTSIAAALNSSAFVTGAGNWLNPWPSSPVDSLWQDPKFQPCPVGWRMPTTDELRWFVNNTTKANNVTGGWLRVQGDVPGEYLLFPPGGFRGTGGGMANWWGDPDKQNHPGNGYYYSSEWNSAGVIYLQLTAFNGGTMAIQSPPNANRVDGRSIRAVLDIEHNPEP
jgi:hypothetical protein